MKNTDRIRPLQEAARALRTQGGAARPVTSPCLPTPSQAWGALVALALGLCTFLRKPLSQNDAGEKQELKERAKLMSRGGRLHDSWF